MKIHLWFICAFAFCVACATGTPTTTPMSAPAQAVAASATPLPTAIQLAPTATTLPTAAARPFTTQHQFPLRELPGVGRSPIAIAVSGDRVYVLNSTSQNIAVIQNERVSKFIPLPARPNALAVDSAQNRFFVALENKTVLTYLNDQIVASAPAFDDVPRALLFFENRLFIGLDSKTGIVVFDPTTLQIQARLTIPDSFTIISLAGDAAHRRVYANAYQKTAVIDAATMRVQAVLSTKGSYETLLANPVNDNALIGVYDSETQAAYLSAFDPRTGNAGARVRLGGDPRAAIANRAGTRAYVANSYTNDVSVIDPRTLALVATIPVGLQPWSLALDENAQRLYVANYGGDSVIVLDTATHQTRAVIPLGMQPSALLADESAGRVYIANASTDSVFVVEGARIVKEIRVGHHPVDLARDAKTNRVFVANQADGTLSIIDETTWAVSATQPITRYVTSVAMDAARNRVFVNGAILDATTLSPIGALTMRGFTVGSVSAPTFLRVNPNTGRIYANGGNGIPGSNGRMVTYSLDGASLQQRGTLSYSGNTLFFTFDPNTNRVFLAGSHPMAYTHELGVYDLNDTKVYTLPLPSRTTGIAFNPSTRHLFLAHANTYVPPAGRMSSTDNMIRVLDTDSFGEVARIALDLPGKMARLGNTIYVATEHGTLALLQDSIAPTPPSPTPIFTPTPFPTLPPPTVAATRVPTLGTRATTVPTPICALALGTLASQKWSPQLAARLGCPTELERRANFATQVFTQGTMLWREDEKRIYVLFTDKTWAQFDDAWSADMPEDACPAVTAPANAKPKRGFGKVWCEQTTVRAKLGLATSGEIGYPAPVQRFERGAIFASHQVSQVFILLANGTWE